MKSISKRIVALAVIFGAMAALSFHLLLEKEKGKIQLNQYVRRAARCEARFDWEAGRHYLYEPVLSDTDTDLRTNAAGELIKGYVVMTEADRLFVAEYNARKAEFDQQQRF